MNPIPPPIPAAIDYPETDGLPMAENTRQFRWIVTIKEGLQFLFRDRNDVFVAGDLFWYPIQGRTEVRVAPDALVVFGRPPGDRRSYLQWEEAGIAPQVVFEVLSPGNTASEMRRKLLFYDRHGVEEYYVYDPEDNDLEGWIRAGGSLRPIAEMAGWTSPLLGIRFDWDEDELRLLRPDGDPLLTYDELGERALKAERLARSEKRRAKTAQRRADTSDRRAESAEQRAESAEQRAEAEKQRADRLAEQLRALGIDPDS